MFEEGLAYDNARLPQALILAGCNQEADMCRPGLKSPALACGSAESAAANSARSAPKLRRDASAAAAFVQQRWKRRPPLRLLRGVAGDHDSSGAEAAPRIRMVPGSNDLSVSLVDLKRQLSRRLHPDRPKENERRIRGVVPFSAFPKFAR